MVKELVHRFSFAAFFAAMAVLCKINAVVVDEGDLNHMQESITSGIAFATTSSTSTLDRVLNRFDDCDIFDNAWDCKDSSGCYWFDGACYTYDDDNDDDNENIACHKIYRSKKCDKTVDCYWDNDVDKCYYEDECYNIFRPRRCDDTNDCIWYRDEEKCLPKDVAHDHQCRKKSRSRQCNRTFACKWDRNRCVYDDYNDKYYCEDINDPWECKSQPECLLIEYGKYEKDCINKKDAGKIDCWDVYSKSSCESIYGCEWNYEKRKCYDCP